MNFSKQRHVPEPEINLIPFIDVLLVVLIFLMLSTTYSKFTELQVKLPTADADKARDYPKEVIVSVSSDGRYSIKGQVVEGKGGLALGQAIAEAAQLKDGGSKNTVVVVSADALASHQSVIAVMEGARLAGLSQVTFATQQSGK